MLQDENIEDNGYAYIKRLGKNALIEFHANMDSGLISLAAKAINLRGNLSYRWQVISKSGAYQILEKSGSIFTNSTGTVNYNLPPMPTLGDFYTFCSTNDCELGVSSRLFSRKASQADCSITLVFTGAVWSVESIIGAWR